MLFPQPEAPTNATNSPGWICDEPCHVRTGSRKLVIVKKMLALSDTPLSTRMLGARGYENCTLVNSKEVQPAGGPSSLFFGVSRIVGSSSDNQK